MSINLPTQPRRLSPARETAPRTGNAMLYSVRQSLPKAPSGALQLAVYSNIRQILLANLPLSSVETTLKEVERRRDISPEQRSDARFHIGGRMYAYEVLQEPNPDDVLRRHLAAEILWLALNHFEEAELINQALQQEIEAANTAALSVSIGTGPADTLAGTRWAIAVGDAPHDLRPHIANPALALQPIPGVFTSYDLDPDPRR